MALPTEDGFSTVGDMGWLDTEGYLYIADRRTDMIISGGSNVFPAEVEAALCEHPAIAEAAVVGVTDEHWGRRVHALVVVESNSEAPEIDDLRRYMSSRLVSYKTPKTYELCDQLEYTDVGKINRKLLTEKCNAVDNQLAT